MRKLSFLAISFYCSILAAFSQNSSTDTSAYKPRKLTFEEANIVSSYYHQDGNNSAVTGGIGTEKLTDIANTFSLKLKRYDKKNRKHTLDMELGVDHYTSASSDKIDPATISSASSSDNRFYPSINWKRDNEEKGTVIGAGASGSFEYDYTSIGANVNFSKKILNKSGELSASVQAFLDQVTIIRPVELRNGQGKTNGTSPRNSYSVSLGYSQIINQRLQVEFLLDLVQQKGFLGLPFHRIYFLNSTESVENLPGARFKLPVGFRANYFAGDRVIIRSYYRYYQDDWGVKAHTFNLETPIKITPFVSVSPFYRFYAQQATKYFAPYKAHKVNETYYTSNYDLSTFNSNFFGAGIRLAPPENIFGINHLSTLELRFGHYSKNIGMQSNIVSLGIGFK